MPFYIQFEEVRGRGKGWEPGFRAFQSRLGDMSSRALDMEPAFRKIHESFLRMERERFNGKNDWQPLTPRYEAWKIRNGRDPRVMRSAGVLHAALSTGAGPGAVTEISPQEATFGTNLHHAVFAQRGSGRRRRRVLVITRGRRGRWAATIRRWVQEGKV